MDSKTEEERCTPTTTQEILDSPQYRAQLEGMVIRQVSPEIMKTIQKIFDEQLGPIIHEAVQESLFPELDVHEKKITNKPSFMPEARLILKHLASESGEPASVVLLRALGLYKIALDAKKEGNRIAVVDQEWDVVQEITGIGISHPEGMEVQNTTS